MKIAPYSPLSQQLAAQYALGTLRGPARRRFEQYLQQEPALRAEVIAWQARLNGLNELVPPIEPAPQVWQRIEQQLGLQGTETLRSPASSAPASPGLLAKFWQAVDVWRGLALAGSAASLVLAVLLVNSYQQQRQTNQTAQVLSSKLASGILTKQVALLAGDDGAPQVMVYWDENAQQLRAKTLHPLIKQADKSLQLWAIEPGQAPRSMGLLDQESDAQVVAFEQVALSALDHAQLMAISVEPSGGSIQPTGPIILKGALIKL